LFHKAPVVFGFIFLPASDHSGTIAVDIRRFRVASAALRHGQGMHRIAPGWFRKAFGVLPIVLEMLPIALKVLPVALEVLPVAPGVLRKAPGEFRVIFGLLPDVLVLIGCLSGAYLDLMKLLWVISGIYVNLNLQIVDDNPLFRKIIILQA
jgi:hypothetical protein